MAKAIAIQFDRALFVLGLGTKGARRLMAGTVAVDATKIPPHVNAAIWEKGADILLRQASQVGERTQVAEWEAVPAHKGKDAPPIATFPFDYARLERDAIAAMEARVKDWYAGDLGRQVQSMNAVDRRASELIEAGLRNAFARAKRAVPEADALAALVVQVLADPAKGPKYRAEAERQLTAERDAGAKAAEGLMDLVAPAAKTQTAA